MKKNFIFVLCLFLKGFFCSSHASSLEYDIESGLPISHTRHFLQEQENIPICEDLLCGDSENPCRQIAAQLVMVPGYTLLGGPIMSYEAFQDSRKAHLDSCTTVFLTAIAFPLGMIAGPFLGIGSGLMAIATTFNFISQSCGNDLYLPLTINISHIPSSSKFKEL